MYIMQILYYDFWKKITGNSPVILLYMHFNREIRTNISGVVFLFVFLCFFLLNDLCIVQTVAKALDLITVGF